MIRDGRAHTPVNPHCCDNPVPGHHLCVLSRSFGAAMRGTALMRESAGGSRFAGSDRGDATAHAAGQRGNGVGRDSHAHHPFPAHARGVAGRPRALQPFTVTHGKGVRHMRSVQSTSVSPDTAVRVGCGPQQIAPTSLSCPALHKLPQPPHTIMASTRRAAATAMPAMNPLSSVFKQRKRGRPAATDKQDKGPAAKTMVCTRTPLAPAILTSYPTTRSGKAGKRRVRTRRASLSWGPRRRAPWGAAARTP